MATDVLERRQLVTQARKVERLLSQRRRLARQMRRLDDEVRTARKLLRDLAMPTPEPMTWGERGELLPGEAR